MQQFSPHDFTAFKWAGSTDFLHYITVVLLLAVFLAAELNPFYLKVALIVLALDSDLYRAHRAYYGWNPIIQSSSDDWPEFSYVVYPQSGSCTTILVIRGLSPILLIQKMHDLLPSISFTQESDQDGTTYVALVGNHLHRAFGDSEVESRHVHRTVPILRQTWMDYRCCSLDRVPNRQRE